MSAVAQAADGLISAVMGYVIAVLVPAFLTVFYALHSPWYIPVLYVIFVVAAVVGELVNHVVGSFAYAVGFLYGAYIVQDWLAFGFVLVLSIVLMVLKLQQSSQSF